MEGIKSGTVSLSNPNVRSLLESCAAVGIGTAGLNTNHVVKSGGEGGGGGSGGRKSSSVGGKKSISPGGSGSGSRKKQAKVSAAGTGDRNGSGSKKQAARSATANGNMKKNGKTEVKSAGGKNGNAKGGATKAGLKSPKSPKPPKSPKSPKSPVINVMDSSPPTSGNKARRTPTKSVGKPGLAVPSTLYPELVRLIERGGEFHS